MIFVLAVFIGLLVVSLAFGTSYLGDNIIVVWRRRSIEITVMEGSLFLIDSLPDFRLLRRTHSWCVPVGILRTTSEQPSNYFLEILLSWSSSQSLEYSSCPDLLSSVSNLDTPRSKLHCQTKLRTSWAITNIHWWMLASVEYQSATASYSEVINCSI